jgi:hypothetical protein
MDLQGVQTFGRGGAIVRSQAGVPLSLDFIRQRVPALFTNEKHVSRSEKYTHIPTHTLLGSMEQAGFLPAEVRASGSRDIEKRPFVKHLIRFRHVDAKPILNDVFPEVIVINGHDGSSAFHLLSGWFRLVCLNGMVCPEKAGFNFNIPHRGQVGDVIEASYKVVEAFPRQAEKIEQMQRITLALEDQRDFAERAATLRFDKDLTMFADDLLVPRRSADVGNSLWQVFNMTQERLTKGPVWTYKQYGTQEQTSRRARPVNGINEVVKINQQLWALAETTLAAH